MLRLSTNLKGTEHNEDPDSPRSPQAPTAAAAAAYLHSMQPARSPGYHSNSGYRPPAVNHHIINTYTQMAAHVRTNTVHTLAHVSALILALVEMCVHARARTLPRNHEQSYHCFLDAYLPNAFHCEQHRLFL